LFYFFFFFFKQKTAYEISVCDWSSDVCSSDLSRGAVVEDIINVAAITALQVADVATATNVSR